MYFTLKLFNKGNRKALPDNPGSPGGPGRPKPGRPEKKTDLDKNEYLAFRSLETGI